MKHTSRPQSIAWFQDHYKDGRLELRPPFQRKPVWTDKQRSFLIESILMDIPIPEVYVQVTVSPEGSEHFGVVDGQQRLRTILQFIGIERDVEDTNRFALESLPHTSEHRGKQFVDIQGKEREQFFQYEICVRFLYTDKVKDVEDVFKRLNKYTMPLRPQELRNATFHGAFAILAERLADNEYWAVNRIVTPAAIRRMADIEMMSDLLIGLIHGPQGGSSRVIDEYYEKYEQFEDEFPAQPKIKKLFDEALSTISKLFPDIGDVPRWGNRADFYSLFVALGSLLSEQSIKAKNEKNLAEDLIRFAHDVDKRLKRPTAQTSEASKTYARAIEKGSNDKARRMDRHEAIVGLISKHFGGKK